MKLDKRIAATLFIALTWITILMPPQPALATGKGPCSSPRFEVTTSTGPLIRTHKMRHLIRCVFTYVGIPGQIPKALDVARREPGYQPWAINHALYPEHDCLGLFQMMRMYWPGRVTNLLPPRYFPAWPDVSAFNARANTWVAAKMVKVAGWGAWTTA